MAKGLLVGVDSSNSEVEIGSEADLVKLVGIEYDEVKITENVRLFHANSGKKNVVSTMVLSVITSYETPINGPAIFIGVVGGGKFGDLESGVRKMIGLATTAQERSQRITNAIYETIKELAETGKPIPLGPVFAALMFLGISYERFNAIIEEVVPMIPGAKIQHHCIVVG